MEAVNPGQAFTVTPAADQLMRRMLNGVSRLQEQRQTDAADLRRLREERQRDVALAEKSERTEAGRAVAAVYDLGKSSSLGSRLRSELTAGSPHVRQAHADPGSRPDTFEGAIAEWGRLARPTDDRVQQFQKDFAAWDGKLFKRSRSMPVIDKSIWRDLDRLDLIHRCLPALRERRIAERIREVSAAADLVIASETDRRKTIHDQLAADVATAVEAVESLVGLAGAPWSDPRWTAPHPTEQVERLIRLGELCVEPPAASGVASVPALLGFPFDSGIALEADVAGREDAIGLLRALTLRLLAAVPPGALQIKVVDPVSRGRSVAEFRHLSEYDSRLMDEKTWTSERDIERLMEELADHLEVVISNYLRGQFETIDDYNQHAGEVSEPYRLLVVFDYPQGFTDAASRQLLSLIENGPRCGVYTVLHHDGSTEIERPRHQEVPIARLVHGMHKVIWRDDGVHVEQPDPIGQIVYRLLPDTAPPLAFNVDGRAETTFAKLLVEVGEQVQAAQSRPPAVTLDTLFPLLNRSRAGIRPDFGPGAELITTDPATWWTASTAHTAVAPLGRSGAQGVTSMHFSSTDIAGGAIMVGLPRSGKSTSLHSIIMTMSMLYSPEELELYLIDAKHGVEFKVYEHLPHARMVSIHSEREFSLAVLKGIEAEIRRRAELMKAEGSGRANLTEYRDTTGAKLARIVVIMDEFHELFEEMDAIAQEAFAAFSNIVKMGSFSGVHIVVASQTLSNMPAMDRPTLMLLPQRVAFMCNDYEAEIVMGDMNRATRLLSKRGEGLFNPARGDESRNQPFQGLYIPTDERSALIQGLRTKADASGWARRPRVFDGDAVVPRPPSAPGVTTTSGRLTIPFGEPFTLADRESVTVRRTRGANLLLLGDGDDEQLTDHAVRGALHSCILAGAEHGAEVTVIDFVADEEVDHWMTIMDVADAAAAEYVRSRAIDAVLESTALTIEARSAAGEYRAPTKLIVLFGMQRALSLHPEEPSYGYEDSVEPSTTTRLGTILRDGPEVGVHVVISADRIKSVERRLGPDLLSELTLRVAGSAADQQDLASVAGGYSDAPVLRPGQLLLGDLARGTAKRIRGYMPLRSDSHHER